MKRETKIFIGAWLFFITVFLCFTKARADSVRFSGYGYDGSRDTGTQTLPYTVNGIDIYYAAFLMGGSCTSTGGTISLLGNPDAERTVPDYYGLNLTNLEILPADRATSDYYLMISVHSREELTYTRYPGRATTFDIDECFDALFEDTDLSFSDNLFENWSEVSGYLVDFGVNVGVGLASAAASYVTQGASDIVLDPVTATIGDYRDILNEFLAAATGYSQNVEDPVDYNYDVVNCYVPAGSPDSWYSWGAEGRYAPNNPTNGHSYSGELISISYTMSKVADGDNPYVEAYNVANGAGSLTLLDFSDPDNVESFKNHLFGISPPEEDSNRSLLIELFYPDLDNIEALTDFEDDLGILYMPWDFLFHTTNQIRSVTPASTLYFKEPTWSYKGTQILQGREFSYDPSEIFGDTFWSTFRYLAAFSILFMAAAGTFNHLFNNDKDLS